MRLPKRLDPGTPLPIRARLRRLSHIGVGLSLAGTIVIGNQRLALAQPAPAASQPGSTGGPASPPAHDPATRVPQTTDQPAPAAPVAATAATQPGERPWRLVSITLSPLHLTLPVFELTGEIRLAEKFGVAAVVGAGSLKPENATTKVSVYEVGAQVRYYVVGDFRHGMQLGAELMYLNASASEGSVSAVADGTTLGPFVGYKIITGIGFTFDAQLGVQRIIISASASDGGSASDSKTSALLNLNVGWSF